MSNYNKSTNFAVKDTLTSGDPDKVVSGAEIDNEFNAISSAVDSKADKVTAATTDNLAALDANGNLKDSNENAQTISKVAAPSGVVQAFGGTSAPTGWLECDGSSVSRSTYSDLFSVIGTNFGVGDGATTFDLPDLRGEFVRGWDNGRGVDDGRSFGSDQADEIKSHSHTLNGNNRGSTGEALSAGLFDDGAENDNTDPDSILPTGGSETRPRNIALMYIIKT